VYTTELGYFDGAEFGDLLDIRSTIEMDGDYKLIWYQEAWRPNTKKAAVKSRLELVCLDKQKKLLPILDIVALNLT
jgi:acyl-CoA thioesterase FadM